ncbi:MAG: 4-alpha-glucanotransferase [Bacteroidales bacterium]|nr:4-alpha-glucanotransferase [Bacteroidales bacterium]
MDQNNTGTYNPVENRSVKVNGAGILLHITSLPGKYGIGDVGEGACSFVQFLKRSGQSYWQVLPLNITNGITGYSPYSSFSAFAGNPLLIDPDQLVTMGLLKRSMVKNHRFRSGNQVNYHRAELIRESFLRASYGKFIKSKQDRIYKAYLDFIDNQGKWLQEFANFSVLKDSFDQKVWTEWPEKYRDRDVKALNELALKYKNEIEFVKYVQFIFSIQWNKLKQYANQMGIKIFGDIPIYVNHDSADVWAHPELFLLNADRSMKSQAGVPPDYFNENGQQWGMPLFNWKYLKSIGYEWWLERLERNMEWFDILRLDHFRGFASYWEIPEGSETAKEGQWKKGPGKSLFDAIYKRFPDLPFVAEDLGMIDRPVHDLREKFNLPGMRVLQFGFSGDDPDNDHHPSNFIPNSVAYTGTHDNNTLMGWFKKETDGETIERISVTAGKKITGKNVCKEMIRLAYLSVSSLVIIPMQDWLELDEYSRMNTPSTSRGNWLWKLKRKNLNRFLSWRIRRMTKAYDRVFETRE